MEGLEVRVTVKKAHWDAIVRLHPGVLDGLREAPGSCALRFGTRRARARLVADPGLAAGQVEVPAPLADSLCLPGPLQVGLRRQEDGELVIGPLIGLLVSPQALARMRRHGLEPPHTGYARCAAEVGAVLCLFSPGDVDPARGTIAGHRPAGGRGRRWRLHPARFPVPRVVLSRVFSDEGAGASSFISRAPALGCTVLRLGPIGHMEGLRILSAEEDLAPLIPWTRPLRDGTVDEALSRFDDLLIRPDFPTTGTGPYRLLRQRRGWLLTGLPGGRRRRHVLRDRAAVRAALGRLATGGQAYVVQERAPLATFLGHPFDLLALVQQDGHRRWEVSALLARIAATEQPGAGPAGSGWTAAEPALRHAFPSRWQDLWERTRRVAAAAALAVDRQLGPRFEVGVRLAISPGGRIYLLQVEGEPRVERLAPLHDPYAVRRLHGCPIACATALDDEKGRVPRSPGSPGA